MKKVNEIKDELLDVEEYETANGKYKLVITKCEGNVIQSIKKNVKNPLYPGLTVSEENTFLNLEPIPITPEQIDRYIQIIEEAKEAAYEIKKFQETM